MTLILNLIGFAIGIGAPVLFLYLALRSLLSDVWKLVLLVELPGRRIAGLVISLLWTILVTWGAVALLGPSRAYAIYFVVLATVPALAWLSLRWWAWWLDDADTRRDALKIATERAGRLNQPAPRADQKMPWNDYVFDAEVARRRALYEPPPI